MIEVIKIPPQYQAKFAWLLLLCAVLGVVLFLVVPVLNFAIQQEDRLTARYAQLVRYQHVVNSTTAYENQYAHIKKTGLDTLFYPKGLTAAQVAKELQKQLAAIITRDGGTLVRSEVLETNTREDDEDSNIYQKVSVKANLQGSMKLLRNLLHQAYRARPFIFMEDLSIKPLNNTGKKIQQLQAEIIISTYWRGGVARDESMD